MFVVCNGPSLNSVDTDKLTSEITIGCNNIIKHPSFLPKYYCIEDPVLFRKIHDKIPYDKMTCFVAADLNPQFGHKVNFVRWHYYDNDKPEFSDDCSREIFFGFTVTYMMLQIAAWMGADPVYIIGMDGVKPGQSDEDKHFYKGKERGAKAVRNRAYAAYALAAEWYRQHNRTLINITPDTVIDEFDKNPTLLRELGLQKEATQ